MLGYVSGSEDHPKWSCMSQFTQAQVPVPWLLSGGGGRRLTHYNSSSSGTSQTGREKKTFTFVGYFPSANQVTCLTFFEVAKGEISKTPYLSPHEGKVKPTGVVCCCCCSQPQVGYERGCWGLLMVSCTLHEGSFCWPHLCFPLTWPPCHWLGIPLRLLQGARSQAPAERRVSN